MQPTWNSRLAHRTQRMKGSAIRELLKLTEQPEVISFGGGMPAPEIFPVEQVGKACDRILKNFSDKALQYGTTEVYNPLREMLAKDAVKNGLSCDRDNLLITSGSQQALDLIGKVFIDPGDKILVENPTYLGALQAWNAYECDYIPVQSDKFGMLPDSLEEGLKKNPKFLYALPNFQNPTGISFSLERRKKVVELADKYGIPIIEDDPYGKLRYEGEDLPTLTQLDSEMRGMEKGQYNGNVVYLSTFSKILAPGIRLAWVIGPVDVVAKLAQAKQGVDLNTSSFNQMIAYEVGKDGFIDEHVKVIRRVYNERRDVMLDALEEHCPKSINWTHPEGGLFLWVTLPKGNDAAVLMKEALKENVAYVPGGSFHPVGGGENTMRLNFSFSKPETINEGIGRLGRVFRTHLK
ncbi:MAG: PLP-dependent aminotransferase family protein [Leptolinea sp.]|nr:PLP-dependent aminotransferase family protein [Leptolinea sp.]